MRKLNIGGLAASGYVCVDRSLGTEAYPLDFPDNEFIETRASHILEHFPRADIEKVLTEWVRVTAPGGSLKIAVPDFDWIVAHRKDDPKWMGYLFGGQVDENDFHRCAFTEPILRSLMERAGLRDITRWQDEVEDCAQMPVSLNLQGIKPKGLAVTSSYETEETEGRTVKIIATVSCPRLAWTDHWGCVQQALFPLGIELFRNSGVFWGQGLTRLFEIALAENADFILTLDYDSIFSRDQVHRLCQLIIENDDVDAIIPVQVRRENDYSMFTMRGSDGTLRTKIPHSEFSQPLTPITTGHFGLTIIRAASLAKLRKPWFLAVPTKEGDWNEGRTDEDIYFWHNAEHSGWKICLSNEVRIGHLQLMIAWPQKDFSPRHQYVSDWQKNGQPKDCGGDLKIEYAT